MVSYSFFQAIEAHTKNRRLDGYGLSIPFFMCLFVLLVLCFFVRFFIFYVFLSLFICSCSFAFQLFLFLFSFGGGSKENYVYKFLNDCCDACYVACELE